VRSGLRNGLVAAGLILLLAIGALVWRAGVAPPPGSSNFPASTMMPLAGVSDGSAAVSAGATLTTRPPSPPTTRPFHPTGSGVDGTPTEEDGSSVAAAQGASPTHVTIAVGGDIMVHEPQITAALDPATGSYDFSPSFAPVAPYLQLADYAVANFETRTAGAARGYSGYPVFNTPDAIAEAVRGAGFDLVATANNHSLDMGFDGLVSTLDVLDSFGLAHVGNYRSEAEHRDVFVASVEGVRVAFLNYTQDTNGLSLPADKAWALNVLGDGSGCIADAAAARAEGADLVVALLHWGVEYQRTPSESQEALGARLLAAGVDVIIGSHPHVVQRAQRTTVVRAGSAFQAYTAYSLGNFLSNQRERYEDSGLLIYLDIVRDSSGTRLLGVRYLPLYVQKQPVGDCNQWRVLPVVPGVEPVTDIAPDAECRSRMSEVWDEIRAQIDDPAQGITCFAGGAF
jgi:poly-gamma-glutamate capsule biosynthesis protein CapA/YwtB (metallophosphatase superfamily)